MYRDVGEPFLGSCAALWPIVMAYTVMAYTVMSYIVMTYIVMTYSVMAHVVMAYIVMAHIGYGRAVPWSCALQGEAMPHALEAR